MAHGSSSFASALAPANYPVLWQPADYFREARLEEIFPGRPGAPLEVDLGCGNGRFLRELARQYPQHNVLGVERLLGRLIKLARKTGREGLPNVRLLRLESAYAFGWLLPAASVARLHLLFPDPWPKAGQQKKRLFAQEDFVRGLERALQPDAVFHFKTDHADYFQEACEQFDAISCLEKINWVEDDGFPYPQTDFELQWLGQGREIFRACWRKIQV